MYNISGDTADKGDASSSALAKDMRYCRYLVVCAALIIISIAEISNREPGILGNSKLLQAVSVRSNTCFSPKRLLRSPCLTCVEVLNPLHFVYHE